MTSTHLLRLAKLKGATRVLAAAKHNRREIQSELVGGGNIDPTKSHLNYSLTGATTAMGISQEAKSMMQRAGIKKMRKDGVVAVEVVFSLPAKHSADHKKFFSDCLEWTCTEFAGHVLSFDVHLDESAPHAHALILPLINGSMKGSEMVGNKRRLQELHARFHIAVGCRYGLAKPSGRLIGYAKEETLKNVLAALRNDPVQHSKIWAVVRDMITVNPAIFASALGIMISRAKAGARQSFVEIMTSKGHGSTI
ncbi:uncharacterized protein NMK_1781 [Novimethylophilus kurashikiensis]|uniref:Plasmid recombination enzyme n=1 Tax=Novimethylophilus kurashikiensis TaxID=1825523 RepID=A0A2R5F7M8_9PROT|nr:plasmid recombination protein [Novimethylophilus kurashikiensis]GBG14216.1 uncharacterized protein NMK_1781 [Novimethylophilus kurashikiensis]